MKTKKYLSYSYLAKKKKTKTSCQFSRPVCVSCNMALCCNNGQSYPKHTKKKTKHSSDGKMIEERGEKLSSF